MSAKENKTWFFHLKIGLIFLVVWLFMAFGIRIASGDIIFGSDYYTFYTAARAYLLDGKNPYSEEVTQMAQLGILGRLAHSDEDQLGFAYPFFMLFWVMPFAWFNISISQSLWMSLNILIMVIVLTYQYKEKKFFILPGLTFYPFIYGIIMGNFSNLICVILMAFFYQILFDKPSKSNQIVLGFLLAWTVGKPQLTWLLIIFGIMVALKKRYFYIINSFFISLLFLFGGSLLLFPEWLHYWLCQIQKYAEYTRSVPAFLMVSLPVFTGIPHQIIVFLLLTVVFFTFFVWFWLVYRPLTLSCDESNYRTLYFFVLFVVLSIFLMQRTISNDQLLLLVSLFLGSKPFLKYSPKFLLTTWFMYNIFSWLTFLFSPLSNLSTTNFIFPIVFSSTWLVIFTILFIKFRTKVLNYAPE